MRVPTTRRRLLGVPGSVAAPANGREPAPRAHHPTPWLGFLIVFHKYLLIISSVINIYIGTLANSHLLTRKKKITDNTSRYHKKLWTKSIVLAYNA